VKVHAKLTFFLPQRRETLTPHTRRLALTVLVYSIWFCAGKYGDYYFRCWTVIFICHVTVDCTSSTNQTPITDY